MIEKPDVPDDVILRALESLYSIRGTRIEFVPRGLDANAWAYRVDARADSYFVKVNKGAFNETGAWMPRFLADQGLRQVIPTRLSNDGGAQATAGGLTFRVQPFVKGERAMDAGMSAGQWQEYGAFLRQLHGLEVPPETSARLRRESFSCRRLEWVEGMQERVEIELSPDPICARLFGFWRVNHYNISRLIERTQALVRLTQAVTWSMVLCHADAHTGNILLGEDRRLYVVDWDDAMLAPKERDLMFVLAEAGPADRRSFFQGYGEGEIDPRALAYYQHDWCIEDMGAFGEEILDAQSTGEETRANSLWWFKSLFSEGGSAGRALANAIDLSGAGVGNRAEGSGA